MAASPDILGVAELARAAGVKPKTLTGYLSRGQCPQPDYRLACGPIWLASTVESWIAERDRRVETLKEAGDAAWGQEVSMLGQYVYQAHMGAGTRAAKGEQARRNVHNGKLARMQARGYSRRKGQGFVPTLKEEAAEIADHLIQTGQAPMIQTDPRLIQKRNWAVGVMQRRQANRVGTPDGIPF